MLSAITICYFAQLHSPGNAPTVPISSQMAHINGQDSPINTANRDNDPRFTALVAWLKHVPGFSAAALAPASGDASFRRYFRLQSGQQTRIVMDAPPPQEDCVPFVEIAAFLRDMGLNGPEVLQADIEQGFLLLSDLGQRQYLGELTARPAIAGKLYRDAINALIKMQHEGRRFQDKLPIYDESLLRKEMSLFHDWLCERHLGIEFSSDDERQWSECCAVLVGSALAQPAVFVHRDYHSRNLMLTAENNPGILDFQDAVLGPFTYDLVSLLRDCYIRWPEDQVHAWALEFYGVLDGSIRAAIERETFLRFFDLMGVQRHLKAAGIFARLLHRDGKPGYMGDVPRTLQYVVDVSLRYPEIRFLAKLIEQRCMPLLLASAS